MPKENRQIRFENALIELDLTPDEVYKDWIYCGGDKLGSDLDYWNLMTNNQELPEKHSHCICQVPIKHNYYITCKDEILIIGSICKKQFVKVYGKSCEICSAPHQTRVINRCINCKNESFDNDSITFGKYKNTEKTLSWIYENDYDYAVWIMKNCEKTKEARYFCRTDEMI
jgi:hypothetical protein